MLFLCRNIRGRGQRPNSKYRPNCWTEDPNDQPPPMPMYPQEESAGNSNYQDSNNSKRRRRRRQVPCLWELENDYESANNY